MFYEESLINKLLMCKVCEFKLVDPRILPCGGFVCHNCVESLTNAGDQHVKCPNCLKTHEQPQDGFPCNQELALLVELKPDEVTRSKQAAEFKSISNLVREKAAQLDSDLKLAETKIKEECDVVRNQIQLAIEQAHLKLDAINKQLMDEIDEHEQECLFHFKEVSQNKAEIETILVQSNEFSDKSNSLFKKYALGEHELTEALDEARHLLANIEKTTDKLDYDIYKNNTLKFLKNPSELDRDAIGRIQLENRELHFLEKFSNSRESKLTLSDLFPEIRDHDSKEIGAKTFPSGKVLLSYMHTDNSMYLAVHDRDGECLHAKKHILFTKSFEELINPAEVVASNRTIYVYTSEKHTTINEPIHMLRSFDENLNRLQTLQIETHVESMATFGEDLFALRHTVDGFTILTQYTSDLDISDEVGYVDRDEPFYICDSVEKVLVNAEYYIFSEEIEYEPEEDEEEVVEEEKQLHKITLMNKKTGTKSSFAIFYSNNLFLYSEKVVLAYDNVSRKLTSFDLSGETLNVLDLDEDTFGEDLVLADVSSKELFFFDKNQLGMRYF